MDFLKSLSAVSAWLLRLSLAAVILLKCWYEAAGIDRGSKDFWIALAGMLFAVVLLLGGFTGKSGWTRTGAACILALFGYWTWVAWPGQLSGILWNFLGMSAALYFTAGGNKS